MRPTSTMKRLLWRSTAAAFLGPSVSAIVDALYYLLPHLRLHINYKRRTALILLLVIGFWVGVAPQVRADPLTIEQQLQASPPVMSTGAASITTDDGRWRNIFRTVIRFVSTQLRKSVISVVPGLFQRAIGNADAEVKITFFDIDDIDIEAATNGFADNPFGSSEALASGDILLRFTNETLSPQTLVAIVSNQSFFELAADSPNPNPEIGPLDTGFSFIDLTFGLDGAPPQFIFHRELINGTLTGTLPETSFTYIVAPGGSIDLRTNLRAGGNAVAGTPVPEPATIFLLCTGLAGVGAAVHKRRKAKEPPPQAIFVMNCRQAWTAGGRAHHRRGRAQL